MAPFKPPASKNIQRHEDKSQRVIMSQQSLQLSPFPPEQMLRAYEEIFPGAAEKLLLYTEKNQTHRHEMEKHIVQREHQRHSNGQWMAFVIVLTIIGSGVFLISKDKPIEGFILALTTIAGIAGLFIYAEHAKKLSREKNAPAIPNK